MAAGGGRPPRGKSRRRVHPFRSYSDAPLLPVLTTPQNTNSAVVPCAPPTSRRLPQPQKRRGESHPPPTSIAGIVSAGTPALAQQFRALLERSRATTGERSHDWGEGGDNDAGAATRGGGDAMGVGGDGKGGGDQAGRGCEDVRVATTSRRKAATTGGGGGDVGGGEGGDDGGGRGHDGGVRRARSWRVAVTTAGPGSITLRARSKTSRLTLSTHRQCEAIQILTVGTSKFCRTFDRNDEKDLVSRSCQGNSSLGTGFPLRVLFLGRRRPYSA